MVIRHDCFYRRFKARLERVFLQLSLSLVCLRPACYDPPVANKYFAPGAERASKVRDLFAAIAPRYDLINDLQSLGLHRLWKRRLIRLARVQPGESALDVCCGTGDIARSLARHGAQVTGLDFSEAMLQVARARDARQDVTWMRGDALELPFPDARFDVVTTGYGLRNLRDFEGALSEFLRVLKPGGRLLVLEFGKPDHRIWRSFFFTYLKWIVPIFGKLFCGDAQTHAYILESLLNYPGQRGIASLLERQGCQHNQIIHLLGGAMSINNAEKASEPV